MVLFFIVIQVYECVLLNNVVGENEGGNRTNLKKRFNFLPLFTSTQFFSYSSLQFLLFYHFRKNNNDLHILNSFCTIVWNIERCYYQVILHIYLGNYGSCQSQNYTLKAYLDFIITLCYCNMMLYHSMIVYSYIIILHIFYW